MNLITLLVVLLVLGLVFGGYNHTRGDAGWGYWGWAPGLIVLLLVIMVLVGVL